MPDASFAHIHHIGEPPHNFVQTLLCAARAPKMIEVVWAVALPKMNAGLDIAKLGSVGGVKLEALGLVFAVLIFGALAQMARKPRRARGLACLCARQNARRGQAAQRLRRAQARGGDCDRFVAMRRKPFTHRQKPPQLAQCTYGQIMQRVALLRDATAETIFASLFADDL